MFRTSFNLQNYPAKSRRRSFQARRITALGAILVAACSTGCSSPAQDSGLGGIGIVISRPANPMSFQEILEKITQLESEELIQQLRYIVSRSSGTKKQEASYVLARTLQGVGSTASLQEAIQHYVEARKLDALRERCQWHIAECAEKLGQEKIVRKDLLEIKEKTQSGTSRAKAEYGLAQSYLRAQETDQAKDAFKAIQSSYPDTQYAIGSAYYLGEMLIQDPSTRAEGINSFRNYLAKSPDGHFALDILSRLSAMADFNPTPGDSELIGQVHFVHGDWEAALASWSKAGSAKHWFEFATCHARLGHKSQAKQLLLAGIKSHPDGRDLPDAANMLCRLSTKQEAIGVWKTVLSLTKKYGDLALWNLARRATPAQALRYYNNIVTTYPKSNYAPESAWWLFWNKVRQGKSQEALARAAAAEKKYPRAKAAARFAFWAGKLHERRKQRGQAKLAYEHAWRTYPSDYYGHRAQSRLAALKGGRDAGWSTSPSRPDPNPDWTWPQPPSLISYAEIEKQNGPTVTLLSRLRQFDECMELLPPRKDSILKSWLYANLGLPLDAINTATSNLKGAPQASGPWQMAYPLLYAKRISREARKRKMDPLLVHALVREESRYNHLAVSRSNALGLMQLLPSTAYGVAKRLGLRITGHSDIHVPENNIQLGTHYLSYTLKRYKGNAMLAVASYNGGPGAVAGWLKRFGAGDFDVFVERIPYEETRNYIRKVFGSFWNYQDIYRRATGSGK